MHEIQKYRKNCETVLTPGIPGLWNLEDMDLGCVSKNIKYKTYKKIKKLQKIHGRHGSESGYSALWLPVH